MKKQNGFTMIELVFVIVVLGILAAIAVPKFAATRIDAQISKARSDVAAIRSGIINERQTRIIKGDTDYIAGDALDSGSSLFAGVLSYPIQESTSDGHWENVSSSATEAKYKFHINGKDVVFTYTQSNGVFTCDRSGANGDYCKKLID